MNYKEVMTLINAGFSKDDIMKLAAASPKAVETEAVTKAKEIPAEPQVETPKAPEAEKDQSAADSISNIIESKVKEALAPFDELYGKYATLVGMPQMGSVEPLGIDDIVNKFFEGE